MVQLEEDYLVSPSKDPRAFSIRGSLIAIRKEDANFIKVSFDS